jgi:hypothetical protein
MEMIIRLVLSAGMIVANLSAAAIVQFQVADLGGNLHRYNYSVSGYAFQQNQELAISFDPVLYGTLSNAVGGSGFSLLLLQPNNPPGASGDYSALALANNPSLAGPFRVDFIFKGSGIPAAQPFSINQYDQSGNFLSTISSGVTTPLASTGIPEPGSLSLGSLALLMGGVLWIVRRGSGRVAQHRRSS